MLKTHKIRQIDENRKSSEHIHELETNLHLFHNQFQHLIKVNVDALHERISSLEKDLINAKCAMNYHNDRINENFQFEEYKRPHKCPVCDGTGKDRTRLTCDTFGPGTHKLEHSNCNACEGKGIVWG